MRFLFLVLALAITVPRTATPARGQESLPPAEPRSSRVTILGLPKGDESAARKLIAEQIEWVAPGALDARRNDLAAAIDAAAGRAGGQPKTGRTHLMDAMPMRLADELAAQSGPGGLRRH